MMNDQSRQGFVGAWRIKPERFEQRQLLQRSQPLRRELVTAEIRRFQANRLTQRSQCTVASPMGVSHRKLLQVRIASNHRPQADVGEFFVAHFQRRPHGLARLLAQQCQILLVDFDSDRGDFADGFEERCGSSM